MHVIDAVTRSGVSIRSSATIMDAAKLMEQRGVGSLVVVDGGEPVGLVTDRDLVRRQTARRLAPDARVDEVMSSPLITIDAEADLRDAAHELDSHSIRHLVVTRKGGFVGVVTEGDLEPAPLKVG